jgi:hypothetical protein
MPRIHGAVSGLPSMFLQRPMVKELAGAPSIPVCRQLLGMLRRLRQGCAGLQRRRRRPHGRRRRAQMRINCGVPCLVGVDAKAILMPPCIFCIENQ